MVCFSKSVTNSFHVLSWEWEALCEHGLLFSLGNGLRKLCLARNLKTQGLFLGRPESSFGSRHLCPPACVAWLLHTSVSIIISSVTWLPASGCTAAAWNPSHSLSNVPQYALSSYTLLYKYSSLSGISKETRSQCPLKFHLDLERELSYYTQALWDISLAKTQPVPEILAHLGRNSASEGICEVSTWNNQLLRAMGGRALDTALPFCSTSLLQHCTINRLTLTPLFSTVVHSLIQCQGQDHLPILLSLFLSPYPFVTHFGHNFVNVANHSISRVFKSQFFHR